MTTRALLQSFTPRLSAYEAGDLDRDDVIALFQDLTDWGVIWELQGGYVYGWSEREAEVSGARTAGLRSGAGRISTRTSIPEGYRLILD
jgi:hypothetical protein